MTSYIMAYTNNVAPPYKRTYTDRNSGAALNLTGALFTGYLQNQATGAVTTLTGTWTINSPASAGVAQYQWIASDLATIGTYSIFVRVQVAGETGQREFDPDVLIVIPSAEYLAALIGGLVGTDINIAGLGAGGSTPVTTSIPADVLDRVGRLLGHVIVDTLPSLVLSAGAANIGSVTANAGTNLNTSTLALETGGNLAAAKADLDTLVTQTATPNVSDRWARQVGQVDLARVNGASLSNTNPAPVQWVSQSGYVALSSPPTQTNAGSDTTLTFSSQVNTVILQNSTAGTINFAFDTAASLGSLALAAGQMLIYSKKVTTVHLYTASATNVNGASASNIVVLGEL